MEEKPSIEVDQELENEKRKISELFWEIKNKKSDESERINWMYKNPSECVDREEYLLGRSVDRALDLLQGKEDSATTKQLSNIPKRIVTDQNRIVNEQVDLQKKIHEDPLFAIREKEIAFRKQLLNNPLQMKKIKEMIELQERNAQIADKKKKKLEKQMINAENIDQLIIDELNKVNKKINIAKLIKQLDESSDESDEDSSVRKKTKRKAASDDDDRDRRKSSMSSNRHHREKRKENTRDLDNHKSSSKHKRERRPSVSSDSDSSVEKFKTTKKRRNKSESSGKIKEENCRSRKRRKSSSPSSSSSEDSSLKSEDHTSKRKKRKFSSDEISSLELDEIRRKSKHKNKVNSKESSTKTSHRYKNRLSQKNSNKGEKLSHSHKRERHVRDSSATGDDSDSSNSVLKSKKDKNSKSSKRSQFLESAENHAKNKLKYRREKHEKKEKLKLVSRTKSESESDSEASSEKGSPTTPQKKYGLSTYDGSKPNLTAKNIAPYRKVEEKKGHGMPQKARQLTEKEVDEELRKMMKNAEWRKKERKEDYAKHKLEKQNEEKIKDYDDSFVRNQLSSMTSTGSMADRLKTKINTLQRGGTSMDKSFVRK